MILLFLIVKLNQTRFKELLKSMKLLSWGGGGYTIRKWNCAVEKLPDILWFSPRKVSTVWYLNEISAIFTWKLRVPPLYWLWAERGVLVCNRCDKGRQISHHLMFCRHFSAGFIHAHRRQHNSIPLKSLRFNSIKVGLTRRPDILVIYRATCQPFHFSVGQNQR